jgi:hypothetical protein
MEQKLAVAGQNFLPVFVEKAFQSFEGMKEIATMYADSRTIADHFYEKGPDRKPDYSKPMIPKIQAVLTRGIELHIKPTTALQGIVPINGLLSLKVDLMKSMIFSSGTMASGGWVETIQGNVESGDYTVIIMGKRTNGMEMTRSFSIEEAKRAGLWVTPQMVSGQDGWKYKQSAWWKYGPRMIQIRAAGFLCRDLWGDVIDNSVSFEEARDYPDDTSMIVTTTDGKEIIINDKDFVDERSKNLTSKASTLIDKRMAYSQQTQQNIERAKSPQATTDKDPQADEFKKAQMEADERLKANMQRPATPEESFKVWTEEELLEMDTADVLKLVEEEMLMVTAMNKIPGKNTNKKLRTIVLEFQKGKGSFINYMAGFDENYTSQEIIDKQVKENDEPELKNQAGEVINGDDEVPGPAPDDMTPDPNFDNPPEQEEEEQEEPEPEKDNTTNQFDIIIPELVDGKRSFDQVKKLYEETMTIAGLSNEGYLTLIQSKFPDLQKYRNREDFCYKGEITEINALLNSL